MGQDQSKERSRIRPRTLFGIFPGESRLDSHLERYVAFCLFVSKTEPKEVDESLIDEHWSLVIQDEKQCSGTCSQNLI